MDAEPTLYQYRMKPSYDEKFPWTLWSACSKEAFNQYKEKQARGDWIYEVRKLYLHPAPAVVRQPLTDDEINSLQLPESGTGTIRDLVRVVELAHGIGGSDE